MDWQNIDIKTAFRSEMLAPDPIQNAHYIVVSDGEILGCDTHDRWQPLNDDELHWSGIATESRHFLGWVDDAPIFALEADADSDEPQVQRSGHRPPNPGNASTLRQCRSSAAHLHLRAASVHGYRSR